MVADGQIERLQPAVGNGDTDIDLAGQNGRTAKGDGKSDNGKAFFHGLHLVGYGRSSILVGAGQVGLTARGEEAGRRRV
jgi:hypothetical protein